MNKTLYLLTFLFSSFLASGQMEKPQGEVVNGMNMDRLNSIDAFIQSYVDQGLVPGGVFKIARQGKTVYSKSFGYQNPEKTKAYNVDDIFRLASMTKAITTVAIMQQYEKGTLGLDDPIKYYIPAFANMKVIDTWNPADSSFTAVDAKTDITIRMLLTHTSGIVYGDFNPGKIQAIHTKLGLTGVGLSHPTWDTEELVNQIAAVPLAFEPGIKYTYGLNMEVLGRIVEIVSRMELDEYFEQNIFKPVGMKDTYFHLPKSKYDRLVPIYTYDKEGKVVSAKDVGMERIGEYPRQEDNHHYAGGGGLSGTAEDYLKFIQTLLDNSQSKGPRILGRKTIETMTSDQMIMQNAIGTGMSKIPGVTYCLGFALLTDEAEGLNQKSAGTYEWGGAFNTKYFIDPKEELTFVGMTQIIPFRNNDFWDRLYTMIYASLED